MHAKFLITNKMDQSLVLSPQMQQAISLLQYNSLDLAQHIQQRIDLNPFLECESEEVETENETIHILSAAITKKVTQNNHSLENQTDYSLPENLQDHLLQQLGMLDLNQQERLVGEFIVNSINDDGYLFLSLTDIQTECKASPLLINKIINQIQKFDPLGICARNLSECLLMQIEQLKANPLIMDLVKSLITEYLEDLATGKHQKILSKLKISSQQLKEAIHLIRTLEPHPGRKYLVLDDSYIHPEVMALKINDEWQVQLADRLIPKPKINDLYKDLLHRYKNSKHYEGLHQELYEAKWLIQSLQRRNETLLKVSRYIVQQQSQFLDHGCAFMKPMKLNDIANALNVHESTISRITTGKYIATPTKTYELKFFLSNGIVNNTGKNLSATAIRFQIQQIIASEDQKSPLSDSVVAQILSEKGIRIARRTVAKYRESLKILPANKRHPF
jgi:RNA polymerase sigma-54 factor